LPSRRVPIAVTALVISLSALPAETSSQTSNDRIEWRYVGADQANTRHSPAGQITPDNVRELEPVWTWQSEDRRRAEYGTVPGGFTSTPIMIDGTVYVSSNYHRVAALDGETVQNVFPGRPVMGRYRQ